MPEEFGPKIRVIGRIGILVESPKTLKLANSSSVNLNYYSFRSYEIGASFAYKVDPRLWKAVGANIQFFARFQNSIASGFPLDGVLLMKQTFLPQRCPTVQYTKVVINVNGLRLISLRLPNAPIKFVGRPFQILRDSL